MPLLIFKIPQFHPTHAPPYLQNSTVLPYTCSSLSLKFHSFTLHMPLLIFKIFVSYRLIIKHLPYLYSLKNLFHILTTISNWKSTLLIWQLTVPHKNKNQFSNPLKYNSSLLLSGSCIIPWNTKLAEVDTFWWNVKLYLFLILWNDRVKWFLFL